MFLSVALLAATVAVVPPPSLDVAEAQAALNDLRTGRRRLTGYDREQWPTWIDVDGNGCNAREEVLLRQADGQVQVDPVGCTIVAGDWTDPYTGEALSDPADIQIDHVVPLAEAYRSGGFRWDAQRREEFANDLDAPVLLATGGAVNQSKGDDRPDEWLPPDAAAHCDYAIRWIEVKATYGLTVVRSERAALRAILDDC
jgi:hypothetical protein